jgi:hypothetical protein
MYEEVEFEGEHKIERLEDLNGFFKREPTRCIQTKRERHACIGLNTSYATRCVITLDKISSVSFYARLTPYSAARESRDTTS